MKRQDMDLFLHDKGYDFITIPQLTYIEISDLIEPYNRRQKKKAREAKKARRK